MYFIQKNLSWRAFEDLSARPTFGVRVVNSFITSMNLETNAIIALNQMHNLIIKIRICLKQCGIYLVSEIACMYSINAWA